MFCYLLTALGVPATQHHTAAQLVVMVSCLVLMCLGLVLALGAALASDGDRMHLPTRQRVRHDIGSCVRTAKEV